MPKQPVLQGDPKIHQKGKNVLLEAIVESQPAPTAQWFKDDTPISDGGNYKILSEPQAGDKFKLTTEIQKFDKPLAGIYKVNIKNDSGQTSATFTVTAGDAPEFLEKPKILKKDGGKVLNIKMIAQSKVEPKIEWFKDDKAITQTDRVKIITTKDEKDPTKYTLLLEIIGPIKADEAKYKCVLNTSEGSNSQALNLAFDQA